VTDERVLREEEWIFHAEEWIFGADERVLREEEWSLRAFVGARLIFLGSASTIYFNIYLETV